MKNNKFHKTTPLQPYIAIFSGSESASIGSPSPIELLHLARNGELNLRWYACTKENVARLGKMYSFTPFSTFDLYLRLKRGENKGYTEHTLFFTYAKNGWFACKDITLSDFSRVGHQCENVPSPSSRPVPHRIKMGHYYSTKGLRNGYITQQANYNNEFKTALSESPDLVNCFRRKRRNLHKKNGYLSHYNVYKPTHRSWKNYRREQYKEISMNEKETST